MIDITLRVNGKSYPISVKPRTRLIDALRDLGFTGTKEGCGEGECGACTIIMDGKSVLSCMMFAKQAEGHELTTIEGLAKDGSLDKLQKAFIEEGAVQCGYCIPGFIMSAKALLNENKNPSDDEIKDSITGNLCRCTGYTKIVKAIRKVADGEQK